MFKKTVCTFSYMLRFGRKKTVVSYFVVGAVACVTVSLIPSGTDNTGECVLRDY